METMPHFFPDAEEVRPVIKGRIKKRWVCEKDMLRGFFARTNDWLQPGIPSSGYLLNYYKHNYIYIYKHNFDYYKFN